MEILLGKQEKLLRRLKKLLEEEKKVLIAEDGGRLTELVAQKESLQFQLEALEAERLSTWGNATLAGRARVLGGTRERRLLEKGRTLKALAGEIRALQETNALLTRQSMAYGRRLMEILQSAARKNGMTYGPEGHVAKRPGVRASMDRSV